MALLSTQDKQKIDNMVTVVENYRDFLMNIDGYIDKSGYKVSYISEKMGINRNTLWKKRKSGKWTLDEVEKLVQILKLVD